jgi:hypothetical protein
MYYVPNLGPSVYMTPAALEWAERVGQKVEKAEYADVEEAKSFARRIRSKVEDKKGTVLFDPAQPEPAEG